MAWMLRPILPDSATFDGQMVFNQTDYEIDDELRQYFYNVRYKNRPIYEVKNTGFEKKKYKTSAVGEYRFEITLVGKLPRKWRDILEQLAIAINGSGMSLEFKDSFVVGSDSSPLTYNCRWVNAGDFVDNNELLNGGTIDLEAFIIPDDQGRAVSGGEWEKTIDAPASGTEWALQIDEVDADFLYTRVP